MIYNRWRVACLGSILGRNSMNAKVLALIFFADLNNAYR